MNEKPSIVASQESIDKTHYMIMADWQTRISEKN